MNADELAGKVAAHMLSLEGTGPFWGIRIEEMREGYARLSMRVRADMLNGHKTCHGGMIFSLADTAFAYACNSRNVSTVAQAASINFLAPAKEGQVLCAEAKEAAITGRTGSYTVSVRNELNEVVAVFQGLSRTVGGAVV